MNHFGYERKDDSTGAPSPSPAPSWRDVPSRRRWGWWGAQEASKVVAGAREAFHAPVSRRTCSEWEGAGTGGRAPQMLLFSKGASFPVPTKTDTVTAWGTLTRGAGSPKLHSTYVNGDPRPSSHTCCLPSTAFSLVWVLVSTSRLWSVPSQGIWGTLFSNSNAPTLASRYLAGFWYNQLHVSII